jgi:hypothetical protein
VGDYLQACPHVLLGLLVLVEEERVLAVLCLPGILFQGVLPLPGIHLQGVLPLPGIHWVVLPWGVLPIRMGLWEVRFPFLVCLGGLLDQVLLLGICYDTHLFSLFLASILLFDHLTSHVTYRSGAAFTYDDSEAFRLLP